MLEYDRIDISKEIDVNKTNLSKECELCHYWYFKDIGFKYEPYFCNGCLFFFFFFCNGCHDLMQKAFYVKGSACRINFWYMSKDDAINIWNGSNVVDKRGVL